MSRAALPVAVLLLLSCTATAPVATHRTFDPRRHTVVIQTALGTGSGVLIDHHGPAVLTAAHIMKPGDETAVVVVPRLLGNTVVIHVCSVVLERIDVDADLALLRPLEPIKGRHVAKIARAVPPVGTPIVQCGTPTRLYGEGLLTFGRIASVGIDSSNERAHHTDAQAVGGCSGGGVWNAKGELVGVISRRMQGTSLTWFVGVERVRAFLLGGGE